MKSRRAQLVCQHLENISRDALMEYQDVVRAYVRGRQGVYALYRRGKLYYVGLATNLRNRLKHHLKDRHGSSWDRFSVYLTIGDHHLRELESLILRIVKPTGNKQKGKFARSDDLRRRLRRDLKVLALAGVDKDFRDSPKAPKSPAVVAKAEGRAPVLSPYTSKPFKLRARNKGRFVSAFVRRDGSIRFKGKVYNSPSMVGAAACNRQSCNGWSFWTYERAPGDWVELDTIRR